MVYEIVSKCQGIRVLVIFAIHSKFFILNLTTPFSVQQSKAPGGGTNLPISDLIYKPLNVSVSKVPSVDFVPFRFRNDSNARNFTFQLLFEHAVPVVVFQFDGSSRDIQPSPPPETADSKASIAPQNILTLESAEQSPSSPADESPRTNENTEVSVDTVQQTIINKSIEKVANFAYFDKLNSWLGQNLQRECPDISLEIREHPMHGTCIRFCPLELGLADTVPSIEQLEVLEDCLDNQIDILRATVKHKATLNRLVEQSDVLRLVPLYDWAGLGGVRFVPEGKEETNEADKMEKKLINILIFFNLKVGKRGSPIKRKQN